MTDNKDYSQMTIEELLETAEVQAKNYHEGHLVIFKFTGWKVFFGTPDLINGLTYKQIAEASQYKSLKEALLNLLQVETQSIKYSTKEEIEDYWRNYTPY